MFFGFKDPIWFIKKLKHWLFFCCWILFQGHVEEEILEEKEKRIEELEKEVPVFF